MAGPRDRIDAVTDAIVVVGGRFMRDPITKQRGSVLGFKGSAFGFGGRAGVLGDVGAEVVASVLAFFGPGVVERWWNEARLVMPPREAGERYAEVCADFGRARFGGVPRLDQLVDVGEAVIGGAEATGLPLFAAWRTIRRAADTPGHAAQVLHLLREHRGSLHVLAVAAMGLTPLQAIVVSGGHERARQLGFSGELPEPQPYRARSGARGVDHPGAGGRRLPTDLRRRPQRVRRSARQLPRPAPRVEPLNAASPATPTGHGRAQRLGGLERSRSLAMWVICSSSVPP